MAEEQPSTEQLRAQAAFLLSQARSEISDIQRALSAVGGDSALHARLAAAAAQMSDVASQLSSALDASSFALRSIDLAALASIVQADDTESLLTEAATQEGMSAGRIASVASASADARSEVESLSRDMFHNRIFDKYLRFESPADEAEYRARQKEYEKLINEQLALHTPEGDLRAAETLQRAMLDAKDHGAGDSPEFAPKSNELHERIERLRAAMPAKGQPEPDHAAGSDPLVFPRVPRVAATAGAATQDATAGIDFAAMDAKLAAAGLQAPTPTEPTGHGLSIQKPTGKPGPTITG